jgi:lysophospholipase L1-like esterase
MAGLGRGIVALAMVASATLSLPVGAAVAAEPSLEVLNPVEGARVDQGEITVAGRVSTGTADENAWVVYAVDVSGSTTANGFACSDVNLNGSVGEILDCEIEGAIALNTSLAAIPNSQTNIKVGVVPFGSSATIGDVNPAAGVQAFTSPTDDLDVDNDRDRTADVVQVLSSLTSGRVGLFSVGNVGGGTNFDAALNQSFNALESKQGRRIVVLLTDGVGSLTESTLTRGKNLGIEVRPFAISRGSDQCATGGPLRRIAAASGTECVYAPIPSQLTTAIAGQPAAIRDVTVSLDGAPAVTATVDPLGNFTAQLFVAEFGPHTLTVVARFTSGALVSTTRSFTAGTGINYVALGDSYSAGEGITPYLDVPGAGQGCHQSTRGYPRLVGTADAPLPTEALGDVNLDFVACSGAILKNILAVPQIGYNDEQHIIQLPHVDRSTDLVTVSIGGNDAGFSNIVKHCALQFQCFEDEFATLNSGRKLSAGDFLLARTALMLPELQAFYRTLRQRTNDNAAIVVVSYPELFDDGINVRWPCGEAGVFFRDERIWLNDSAELLAGLLSAEANSAGVHFVDVTEVFRGHRVCDGGINTKSEWLVGADVDFNQDGQGGPVETTSFHPNENGAAAYARAISDYLQAQVDAGVALTPSGLPQNPGAARTGLRSGFTSNGVTLDAGVSALTQVTGADWPNIPVDSFPTADQLGYSEEELAEIAAMTFDTPDIDRLQTLRNQDIVECAGSVVPGEHIVLEAAGFKPGTAVSLSVQMVPNDPMKRAVAEELVADATGHVRVSMIVPTDFPPPPDGQEYEGLAGSLAVEFTGIDRQSEGHREVADVMAVGLADSLCASLLASAGDISTDGAAAPSAAITPQVGAFVAVPSFATAAECPSMDLTADNIIFGTSGDDQIIGTNQSDMIVGGDGDDVITGLNGLDVLCGGRGNDIIDGGNAGDNVEGGSGDDAIAGANGPDVLRGGPGTDTANGGSGPDTCEAETLLACER